MHPAGFIFVATVAMFPGSNGSPDPPPNNNGYSKQEGRVTNLWTTSQRKRDDKVVTEAHNYTGDLKKLIYI